ncbi:MAG: hypothetical protein O2783_03600 [Chloroflexi bacterium]|nr:hypothetical protein [Chloroflexota bacterium]
MKMTRATIGVIAALVAILVLPIVASADHSWGSYHWARISNPLTLSLGDNVSGNWDQHLADANSDWNLSAVLNNSVDPGRTSPRTCSPGAGLVEICNRTYGFNGWLGVAGIWVSGEHVTKGYVKVNDSYFNTSTYNTPAWRQLVMCQEIGHVFGLAHQDEDFDNPNLGTCMDYTSSPESNQHPNQHDYDQLDLIYAHPDSFNSWAPAPVDGGSGGGHGKGKKGNAPGLVISEWGKAISTDGKGRPDLFEVDLDNGNKVFTHVFWAD